MWVADFCQDFFLTFIYQYIAFKTRKPDYLSSSSKIDFGLTAAIAEQEGLNYLKPLIEDMAKAVTHMRENLSWEIVREAPQSLAFHQKESIVQMIDEFQFLNGMIYRDKAMTIQLMIWREVF